MNRIAFQIALSTLLLLPGFSLADEKEKIADPAGKQTVTPAAIQIADEPKFLDPVIFLPKSLTQKVTYEFKGWSLLQFEDWLEKTLKVQVLIDEVSLIEEGISIDENTLNDRSKEEPVYLLLQRMLRDYSDGELTYYLEDGLLHITTMVVAEEKFITESYSLAALNKAGYASEEITELLFFVTSGPWFDIDGEGGTMQVLDQVLLVKGTFHIQQEIQAMLKSLLKPAQQTYLQLSAREHDYFGKLEKRHSVNFEDLPLKEAVAQLAQLSKIPIRFDLLAMQEDGIDIETPITLKLENVKLRTILNSLFIDGQVAWVVRDAVLVGLPVVEAEQEQQIALYDVRDICTSSAETAELINAIQVVSNHYWFEIDGEGGTAYSPKPGVIVIRQSQDAHRQILNVINKYRQSLPIAERQELRKKESQKIITTYYKLPTDMANSLHQLLPTLVESGTWLKNGSPSAKGEIFLVASEPVIIRVANLPLKQVNPKDLAKKKPASQKNLDNQSVISVPQSTLIIKQTKANHLKIKDVINRIKHGDESNGYFGSHPGVGFGGSGFGPQIPPGMGDGFFKINPATKRK